MMNFKDMSPRDQIGVLCEIAGLLVLVWWVHKSLQFQHEGLDETRLTHAQIRGFNAES